MQPINNNQFSIKLSEMPADNLIKIFGFLDLKSLGVVASICHLFKNIQEKNSLWADCFPFIESFEPELTLFKNRMQIFCTNLSLGRHYESNQCMLNLYHKTITQVGFSTEFNSCKIAMEYSKVPNASFVVCLYGPSLGITIKNKNGKIFQLGVVKYSYDPSSHGPIPEIEEFHNLEKMPSQYHEYKYISQSTLLKNALILERDKWMNKIMSKND